MASNNWRYVLARTSDMLVLNDLVRAQNRTLTVQLNRAGSASFSLRLTDTDALSIAPLSTCLIIYRNGVAVWSGPIWTIEEQAGNNTIQVNAVGWIELLNHRIITADVTYTGINDGTIAFNLLNTINGGANPCVVTAGTNTGANTRTRTYKRDQNLGQEIQALSDVENGYDYYVDPAARTLQIRAQILTDRPTVIYGLGFGPNNLAEASRTMDGSTVCNRMVVTGSIGQRALVSDAGSITTYGTMEDVQSLSDVPDSAILLAYGGAEVTYRLAPRTTYQLTPSTSSNIQLFQDFFIGDKIRLGVKVGRMKIPASGSTLQSIRIFGATLSIDNNGIEHLSSLATTFS